MPTSLTDPEVRALLDQPNYATVVDWWMRAAATCCALCGRRFGAEQSRVSGWWFVHEVPILVTTRPGGKSTPNYRSAMNMYVGAWRLAQRLGIRK